MKRNVNHRKIFEIFPSHLLRYRMDSRKLPFVSSNSQRLDAGSRKIQFFIEARTNYGAAMKRKVNHRKIFEIFPSHVLRYRMDSRKLPFVSSNSQRLGAGSRKIHFSIEARTNYGAAMKRNVNHRNIFEIFPSHLLRYRMDSRKLVFVSSNSQRLAADGRKIHFCFVARTNYGAAM